NLDAARELAGTKARVVAIPDFGTGLETLEPTVTALERWGVLYLIDPVIEPIGFGFMASLERFAETHRRYPATPLFMGIGNITELFAQRGVDEASHAFYLGGELMKAKIAITLGKTYRQEGQLQWGYLTPQEEPSKHVRLTQRSRRRRARRPRTPRGAPPPGASSS